MVVLYTYSIEDNQVYLSMCATLICATIKVFVKPGGDGETRREVHKTSPRPFRTPLSLLRRGEGVRFCIASKCNPLYPLASTSGVMKLEEDASFE